MYGEDRPTRAECEREAYEDAIAWARDERPDLVAEIDDDPTDTERVSAAYDEIVQAKFYADQAAARLRRGQLLSGPSDLLGSPSSPANREYDEEPF